jgi:hypothetical protein
VILHTSNVLLDPFGQEETRSFSGELFDISRQGVAFTARISSMDKARLLLGRHILTTIVVGDERLPHQNGVIVGVRLYEPIMRDYSVHVRLAKKIDETDFNKIVAFTGLIQ